MTPRPLDKPVACVDAQLNIVLGVSGNPVAYLGGKWHTHHSFGRIVDLLAARVRGLRYHAAEVTGMTAEACDYALDRPNISVHTWGQWFGSQRALRQPFRLIRDYWRLVRASDALFLRGTTPFLWTAHLLGRLFNKRVVHWMPTDQVAIIRAEQRGMNPLAKALAVGYARLDRFLVRVSAAIAGSHFLANGCEVARAFRSPRTHAVVSTSITAEDFHVRDDTCTSEKIRVLFVGFIRPEKGIEYLLRAMPLLKSDRPVELALVGSSAQFSQEKRRLETIIRELGIEDRVQWEGYASFGRPLFEQMDRSDVLVLPTMSEGTPRVLVEARARSLPIVATRVGGIPSSVTDGQDGLLVPPKDPRALAEAMSRIINDAALRKRLIQQGRERVVGLTVERFVDLVLGLLADRPPAARKTGIEIAGDDSVVTRSP